MLLGAFLLEHLAEASESRASRLADNDLGILETSLNKGPQRVEVRLDEERAALDDDTERGNGRLAKSGIGRRGERADLLEQRGKDLSGRKGSRENVDDTERSASGNIVIDIDRLGFGTDGEKGGNDRASEVELLNLRLLELDDPEERVEGHDSEVVVVVRVCRGRHEELNEVGEVGSKEWNLGKSERLEHFEDGLGGGLIRFFEGGGEDADDRGNEVLESSLDEKKRSVFVIGTGPSKNDSRSRHLRQFR